MKAKFKCTKIPLFRYRILFPHPKATRLFSIGVQYRKDLWTFVYRDYILVNEQKWQNDQQKLNFIPINFLSNKIHFIIHSINGKFNKKNSHS